MHIETHLIASPVQKHVLSKYNNFLPIVYCKTFDMLQKCISVCVVSPLNSVPRIKSHLKGSLSDRVQTLHKPLLSCSVFPISCIQFFKIYCSRRGTTYTKAPPVLQRVPGIMHSIVKLFKISCWCVASYTKASPVLQRVSQVKPCVVALSL